MATVVGPLLSQLLTRYGLASLAPWLAERIIKDTSEDQILLELYDRPEFKNRFPAIAAREAAGLNPLSIDEYLAYEANARQAAKGFGVEITQDEINKLLANNVSINELVEDRLGLAAQAVHMSSPELRSELQRLYGITAGDLTRYWLDPTKEAPVLQRRFAAASISEQAQRTGFEQLTAEQSEGLVQRGLSPDRAVEAFDTLVRSRELFEAVDVSERDIGIADQLELLTGDTELTEEVEKRAEKRVAKFQEGGEFATGRTGVAGLGRATV